MSRFALSCIAGLALALTGMGGPSHAQTKTAKSSASKSSKKPTKKSTRRTTRSSRGQAAPAADRIREIQAALARSGHYQGEPTGKWDANTTTAMRNFQQSQGLKETGKLDALTLQKLGLGSPVAGLAPPRLSGQSN